MEQSEYEQTYELEDSHWWFVSRRRLANALLEQWTKIEREQLILDVGCGTGGNLELLAHRGVATGIDLSPLALNLARRRKWPRLVQASAVALPFAGNTFGLVTAFDVLYHRWVTDDNRALGECYRVLQPGGWLLLTEPALPSLWSGHDEIYYARQRYRLPDLRGKLVGTGFQLCFCSYTNMLLLPVMTLVRLVSRRLPAASQVDLQPLPGWLNQGLIGIRNLETGWLRRRGKFPIGSSLICLVQKPTVILDR